MKIHEISPAKITIDDVKRIVRDGIAGLTGFNATADTANSENVIIEKMIFFIVVINF